MIRKRFMISENDEKILQAVRDFNPSLLNDSEALRYVLSEYARFQESKGIEHDFKISLAIQKESEKKINRLFDAVNTLLIKSGVNECIPAAYMESPVFEKSRVYEKEKVIELKQRKDNLNKKRKKMILDPKV